MWDTRRLYNTFYFSAFTPRYVRTQGRFY